MAEYTDKLRRISEGYEESLGLSPEEKKRREEERRKKEEEEKKKAQQPGLLDRVHGYLGRTPTYENTFVNYKKNVNAPKK